MTKHTPDFSYLRGLNPLAFSVDECLKIAEYRSKILRPETKLSEPIIILSDAVHAKDARIAELEADLAAEKSEHLHTVKCFDEAWGKIEWLRSALKRQFWRAQGEREKVERLREAIAKASSSMKEFSRGWRDDSVAAQWSRSVANDMDEALAATAPNKSPVDTFARFEKRGPGMTDVIDGGID